MWENEIPNIAYKVDWRLGAQVLLGTPHSIKQSQDKQRELSGKTLRSPFSAEFCEIKTVIFSLAMSNHFIMQIRNLITSE